MNYYYEMTGTAAEGQTWMTHGYFELEPSAFSDALRIITKETFEKLTSGKALFGHPGVGCNGPYGITKVIIAKEE